MDLESIASVTEMQEETFIEQDLPPIIPESELQHDSDLSCYLLSWPDQALAQDIENLKRHLEVKRLLSGCEIINTYTTNGDKAGRADIAQVVQYQKGRFTEPTKKARVEALRVFLRTYETDTVKPQPQWEIEADDAIGIRQREMIKLGRVTKIMSVDKDLDMIPGIHINGDTYDEVIHPDGYGKIWLEEKGMLKSQGGKGVTRKLKGIGTSFFFAQLIMGDSADDIPGLPKLTGNLLNKYKPNKTIDKAFLTLRNNRATVKAKAVAKKVLENRKAGGAGPATAYLMLKACTTNKEAFNIVRDAYTSYYGKRHRFVSWRGKKLALTAGDMLLEQARLLWMLRTLDDDVLDFLKSI